MIFQLSYRSVANKDITNDDLKDISVVSKSCNREHEVTGYLVYYNKVFIQLLEGDETAVKKIFEKIKQDSRHSEIKILSHGTKEKRMFPNWGMTYYFENESNMNSFIDEIIQFKNNLLLINHLIPSHSKPEINFWFEIKRALSNYSYRKNFT